MREYKFRGLIGTTNGNKWVYGYLYKVESFFNDKKHQYFIRDEHLQDFVIDEETIGQYTGLKDKNGVEICEGDIVKIQEELCVVEYNYNAFCLKVIDQTKPYTWVDFLAYKCEVIGNTTDNQKLGEVQNEQ